MRKFRVVVNGQAYEVEVEEIGGQNRVTKVSTEAVKSEPVKAETAPAPVASQGQAIPKTPPAPQSAKPAASVKPARNGGKGAVTCPMPGVISEIKVKTGDRVKKGAVLVLLEAMKMQNEIMAPYDAEVTEVVVSNGASVNSGDVLVRLEQI